MRSSPVLAAVLDGVNVTAVGLMAGVSLQLAGDAIVDPLTVAIALAAAVLLWRTDVSSMWLIAGGAGLGLANAVLV
jgi:chromate transporter